MTSGVAFRADASRQIGSGHIVRCLTLARALRDQHIETLFICREHPCNLADWVAAEGFQVARLPVDEVVSQLMPMHRHWLGASPDVDADRTCSILDQHGFDATWLVVDHYALDTAWERRVRQHAERLMVIDDLADRAHDCDVLLDQNLVANYQTRYDSLVGAETRKLLGPRYALLHPDYASLHKVVHYRNGPPRRILVYFGASDVMNLTGLTLSAFVALGRNDVLMDLVIGTSNTLQDALTDQARGHPNISIHKQLPSLAFLMAQADLAIGAGGTTSWERLCLKLPSIVVTVAENQRAIAEELHRRGLILWLGDASEIDRQQMQSAISAMLERKRQPELNDTEPLPIDGCGVGRVIDVMKDQSNWRRR